MAKMTRYPREVVYHLVLNKWELRTLYAALNNAILNVRPEFQGHGYMTLLTDLTSRSIRGEYESH